jgi:hypothetical protein
MNLKFEQINNLKKIQNLCAFEIPKLNKFIICLDLIFFEILIKIKMYTHLKFRFEENQIKGKGKGKNKGKGKKKPIQNRKRK